MPLLAAMQPHLLHSGTTTFLRIAIWIAAFIFFPRFYRSIIWRFRVPKFVFQLKFWQPNLLFWTWWIRFALGKGPDLISKPYPFSIDRWRDILLAIVVVQLIIIGWQLVRFKRPKLVDDDGEQDLLMTSDDWAYKRQLRRFHKYRVCMILLNLYGVVLIWHLVQPGYNRIVDLLATVPPIVFGLAWSAVLQALTWILSLLGDAINRAGAGIARVCASVWAAIPFANVFKGIAVLCALIATAAFGIRRGYIPLALWLIALTVALIFWGPPLNTSDPWKYWEFGSLISVLITNEVIDFFRFFIVKHPDEHGVQKTRNDLLGSGFIRALRDRILVTLPLLILSGLLLKHLEVSVLNQLWCFIALYIIYVVANSHALYKLKGHTAKSVAHRVFHHELVLLLRFVDVPFMCSYFLLTIFYLVLRTNSFIQDRELHAFVGGASALKMIVQGIIYTLIVSSGKPQKWADFRRQLGRLGRV